MKTKNIISKLGFAVILFMATTVFNSAMAQKYGGSAYVHVKNKDGNTRVLNAVYACDNSSESQAKSFLESELRGKKEYNEDFDSQVYYSIDRCEKDDDKKYGGTASVRVANDKGNTRVLNASYACDNFNKPQAKAFLQSELLGDKEYNENFVSGISYSIESCNK